MKPQISPGVQESEENYPRVILVCTVAASISFPILLYAYLGHFSRLMSDDYCAIAIGKELGAWDGMRHWYESWAGSFANFFFKSAIAPLDTAAPSITPLLILALFWLAVAFLLHQGMRLMGLEHPRRPLSFLLAAATVAASVNALYSPQSFYWFAASTHYTLPLAPLAGFLGLSLLAAGERNHARVAALAVAGGGLCFVSGGASEIFVAFQIAFVTLCALPLLAVRRSRAWNNAAVVIGAGWLATLAALALQLASPGLAQRAAYDSAQFGQALREPVALLRGTLALTLEYLGHPPAFAGFVLLATCALLATLMRSRAEVASPAGSTSPLAARPLYAALAFQLFWLPLLWTHVSNEAGFFGRFSAGFMVVVLLNVLLMVVLALLAWQRQRLNAACLERADGQAKIIAVVLAGMFMLFALTQIRSIHFRAAAYLFTTAVSLLVVLAWQLSLREADLTTRRLGKLSLYTLLVALASLAATVFVALFGRGFVDERILAPAACLLVAPGLCWGAYLGRVIATRLSHRDDGSDWLRAVQALCLVVTLTIGFGMTLGHADLVLSFQVYAREWDARHHEILRATASGQREIIVGPLTFDLADHVKVVRLEDDPANRCALRYYGVDAIRVFDG